ncbi:TRAP transporter small permease [Microbacterium sp. zg.B48]|uniref:TRAP transporter small permease n=1 Tax=unclassified Microbacterium TaxID=2609290 RepID=UPI00214B9EA7|nr:MULTISPECIES: TRAP transporter small permease [unclassified Microbacterium]MCR2764033.1 TRAP transporter small permease [Microbacterium sp. zg.B48]MCR2810454.1 TRAP transporter small permease [Microbacterium sp. zg.B185]WIM18506.1 TRAP transporter small permease [Microbacterium sp. zg-B185]
MSAPGLKDDPIPVVENVVVWTAAVSAIIATLATLGIVAAFVSSVVARWFGQPFDVTNTVSGLLVTATFAGMAWTTVRGEQVSVQVVTERLGPKANHILDIVIWALASGYLVWLLWASVERAIGRTWPVPETVINGVGLTPLWPWRWVFAAALVPFLLVVLLNLLRALRGRRPYDDVMQFDDAPVSAPGVLTDREALRAASLAEHELSFDGARSPEAEGDERR